MARLIGGNAEEVFRTFHEHVKEVFNRTLTDSPLILTARAGQSKAVISFLQDQEPTAIALSPRPLHLFFVHTVQAVRESKRIWNLRTLAYTYRIQLGPARTDWRFRFEYISPEEKPVDYPRHHLHIPVTLEGTGECPALNCERLHLPTGWVMFEELIRFLIKELGVRSRTNQWDRILRESEELFREWTGRSI